MKYPSDFLGWSTQTVHDTFNWVSGRDWIFATLEGNQYALSKTFLLDVVADLIEVTRRLRALKYVIAQMLGIKV